MVACDISFWQGAANENYGGFHWGGFPIGTIEIYPDRLVIYKKNKNMVFAFGLVGDALQGKGKAHLTVGRNQIASYDVRKNNKGRIEKIDFVLTDTSKLMIMSPNRQDVSDALSEFLNSSAGQSEQPRNNYRNDNTRNDGVRNDNFRSNSTPNNHVNNQVNNNNYDNFGYQESNYVNQQNQTYSQYNTSDDPGQTNSNYANNGGYNQQTNPGYSQNRGYSGQPNSAQASGFRFCPYCGNQLNSNMPFCGYCGNAIGAMNNMNHQNNMNNRSAGTQQSNSMDALWMEADNYHRQGKYREEIQLLKDAASRYPNNPDILIKMGRAYRLQEQYLNALDAYSKALRLKPDDPVIYSNIASVYVVQNQFAMAMPFIEKASGMVAANPAITNREARAKIYASHALCAGSLGDINTASKYIEFARSEGYDSQKLYSIRKKIGLA